MKNWSRPQVAETLPGLRFSPTAWAKLIYRVYEVDPLKCPRGDHQMRVIALIHDPEGDSADSGAPWPVGSVTGAAGIDAGRRCAWA